jgi:hypothetical protein
LYGQFNILFSAQDEEYTPDRVALCVALIAGISAKRLPAAAISWTVQPQSVFSQNTAISRILTNIGGETVDILHANTAAGDAIVRLPSQYSQPVPDNQYHQVVVTATTP